MDIEKALENVIAVNKTKKFHVGETHVVAMAEDCLSEIRQLKAEIARQSATSEEVAKAIEEMAQASDRAHYSQDGNHVKLPVSLKTIDLAITALQDYQPKPESTIEDVLRAMDWLETGDFEIIAGDEEYLANSSHHPNTSRFRKTAITALQAYQPWIPCSERMPTEDDADSKGNLMAYFADGAIETWEWDEIGKWNDDSMREYEGFEEITHWRSMLPEPLKGGTT